MSQKPIHDALRAFDDLPDSALVAIKTVAGVYGRSQSSIWRDVKAERIPAPIRLSSQCVRWNVGALRRDLAERGVTP